MENIKSLYYKKFLQHVIDSYRTIIMQAKPGHCMKITGLAMKELRSLLPSLRKINDEVKVFILSETEKGDEFVHATKLIEMRNNPNFAVLILVPSNSRTSAEDSYGDATFQNLSTIDLQISFLDQLIKGIPNDKVYLWKQIYDLLKEIRLSHTILINYILYLKLNDYSDESWGNGLYLIGLLPDRELVKEEVSLRRRFFINLEKISSVLADFTLTAADRVVSLPIKKNTIQKELMDFLLKEISIEDKYALFECIHNTHPEFNYSSIPWIISDNGPVKIDVNLVSGKDAKKEIVKDSEGNWVLNISKEKKSKIPFTITTEPSPKDNPSIYSFEIALINIEDFSEVGVIKKVLVGTNKKAHRKLSVNIQSDMFDEGVYMLRVRALDENGILLDAKKEFKEERVQAAWLDVKEKDPSLQMEQYRLEKHVAYCDESETFTITEDENEPVEQVPDKRAKVNSFTQAVIHYRSVHLAKEKKIDFDNLNLDRNKWEEGTLNSTYQFDFGAAYAYQIQLPKKLIQLEQVFLNKGNRLGYVEAFLSANPTDTKLLNPRDTAIESPNFIEANNLSVSEDLLSLRQNLFEVIKESALCDTGLTCTLDFSKNIKLVKDYLFEYDNWLRELLDRELDENEVLTIQNLDTVLLTIEMPDGSTTKIRLITPLHPLRLSWMMNLFELYKDWEEKTEINSKYRKTWYRKLDRLFQGKLPMDVAPLVLCDNFISEAYQYIGELTFGWGVYAQPNFDDGDAFVSSYRQLKSYAAMLLNITKDKRIDSDVNLELVTKHLINYGLSHPYTDKLVVNLFNAGDASVFAKALTLLEKHGIGNNLSYEVRLFTDNNMLQSGEALKELLDPEASIVASEAEIFAQASSNRLFPKLRFSLNRISDFVNNHSKYQAHISFLVNPFAVHTELVRPDELSRSFHLNGTICRNLVTASQEGKSFVWNRYYSNKTLSNPVSEAANIEVSIFSRLQEVIGRMLSSTLEESVPATTLRLKDNDMMLLSFIHDTSDWVVTFDKNMGPEFYDLPCVGENDVPYLLDYIPNDESTGVSSYLTTKPTSEIGAIMIPLFKEYGIDIENKKNYNKILEDVRSVSSSLIMQANTTSRKGFEVIGTTLTKRFLDKKGIMKESFLIPIDLHKDLFADEDALNKERADTLVAKIDVKNKEILFSVVEIKCRNTYYNEDELHEKIVHQIENTIAALRRHFEMAVDGHDRLDRELKTLEFKSFLEFYIRRSMRYGQLDPIISHEYLVFLSKLLEGYTIRFKQLGVIFNFHQIERQKKAYYGDAVIYTMGKTVIDEILDENTTLNTQKLEVLDDDEFINLFEPTFNALGFVLNKKDEISKEGFDDIEQIQLSDDLSQEIKNMSFDDKVELIDIPSVSFEDVDSKKISKFPSDYKVVSLSEEEIHNEVAECIGGTYKDYELPICDVIIGKNGESKQFGIIGKTLSNNRIIGIDLNECNTISLFGVQGAGKSYTIGSITEMVIKQFSKVNLLPAPMASVIFHYSDSMDYAPEFTSMVYPNDDEGQLAKLKSEYGAEASSVKDVLLLVPESQVEMRKSEYPNIDVRPIGFDSSELSVRDWMFLLGAMGNDSTYIKELKQIMKACRYNMSLSNIRKGVSESSHMSSSQRSLAEQKLDFASEYITDGNKLQNYLCPGRLIIVDLRDEFIEKDEALGLFVVMLNIFSSVMKVDGKSFNKFIVFDEAHKYMNNKELIGSITTAIREMRHKGVSVMIASQDPMSLPTEIIELSSVVVMHRFSSPAWVKHVQKAITPLQTLTPTEMASLGSGEAYIWANKATDKSITQRPIKISIRPRVTKHGGDTIEAVK